jgi:hypothetical protein
MFVAKQKANSQSFFGPDRIQPSSRFRSQITDGQALHFLKYGR